MMNYRGQRIVLKQYCTVASLPVLISNRGYGLLWDNASLTVFDDSDLQVVPPEHLFQTDGVTPGLKVEAFAGTRLEGG